MYSYSLTFIPKYSAYSITSNLFLTYIPLQVRIHLLLFTWGASDHRNCKKSFSVILMDHKCSKLISSFWSPKIHLGGLGLKVNDPKPLIQIVTFTVIMSFKHLNCWSNIYQMITVIFIIIFPLKSTISISPLWKSFNEFIFCIHWFINVNFL